MIANKELNNQNNLKDNDFSSTTPRAVINHSARRINALSQSLKAQTYLEIGVNKGKTFFQVAIPQKTAVDPKFIFDVEEVTNENVTLIEDTSDNFFSSLSTLTEYDVIFIDGLHTFEQTYRDLCNSLLQSHKQSVFLIDDTMPKDVYSAIADPRKAIQERKRAGIQGNAWHGDVYKAIFALHDFHPSLNYRTIVDSGNPQTLVWHSKSGWRSPLFNSLEKISRLSYFDFLDHVNVLRQSSEKEAIELCLSELVNSTRQL